MAYKPIDLQMSIPRTPDSSAQQNHMAQKPVYEQTVLESAAAKQTERMRTQNGAVEQSGMRGIKDDQSGGNGLPAKRRKRAASDSPAAEEPKTPPQEPRHPFKGRHIDITL